MVASEKARATNLNCEVVAMVKHDKSEPLVDVTYCEFQRHIPQFLVLAVTFFSVLGACLSLLQAIFFSQS